MKTCELCEAAVASVKFTASDSHGEVLDSVEVCAGCALGLAGEIGFNLGPKVQAKDGSVS